MTQRISRKARARARKQAAAAARPQKDDGGAGEKTPKYPKGEGKTKKMKIVRTGQQRGVPFSGLIGFLKKRTQKNQAFEEAKLISWQREEHPVRPPWTKTERELVEARRKLAATRLNADEMKGKRLMRIKFPEHLDPTEVGPGYPSRGLVYANLDIARGTEQREVLKRTESGTPLLYSLLETKIPQPVPDNVFEEYCKRLGIGMYSGEPTKDEQSSKAMDLKPFDLYWEDIRIETNVLIREIRLLPLKTKVELFQLERLERPMHHLSRSCFFSPHYSHKNCEDVVHIFVWLLNRRNIPTVFHIKCLQYLSMVIYRSPVFKRELVKCGGVRIVMKLMQLGMVYCGLMASWACYCLTMAAIGSVEVLKELKEIPDVEERVGEMTFYMFWYYWPTNFGTILQSLLYGAGGIANSLEAFEFL